MRKLIFDNGLTRVYDEGHRDIWNKKVLKRYPIIDGEEIDLLKDKVIYPTGIFIYKSNTKNRNSTIKRLGKNVGTPIFYDCPTSNVNI